MCIRKKTRGGRAFHHRGIVLVRRQRALRIFLMRIANHAEQRVILRVTVDHPTGVEDLVAAVLRVGLREHHQFDIGRIARQCREGIHQIIDLILGQRETQGAIGHH